MTTMTRASWEMACVGVPPELGRFLVAWLGLTVLIWLGLVALNALVRGDLLYGPKTAALLRALRRRGDREDAP